MATTVRDRAPWPSTATIAPTAMRASTGAAGMVAATNTATEHGTGRAADRRLDCQDMASPLPTSVDEIRSGLASVGYLAGESAALVSFLATRLGKPVLVEGPAGVGKTELAKALSRATERRLIRLQCYEGLDESKALYEWNYRKQLLRIQTESTDAGWDEVQEDIFGSEFLLSRPLLTAISSDEPVVLLIDSIRSTTGSSDEIAVNRGRESRNSEPKMSSCTSSQPASVDSVWMRSSCLR